MRRDPINRYCTSWIAKQQRVRVGCVKDRYPYLQNITTFALEYDFLMTPLPREMFSHN